DFGIEGIHKTVDEWFLPDGGTPESPAYAIMAMDGIFDLSIALDERAFRNPAMERAWGALVDGLQGDLTLPTIADTRVGTKIATGFIDVLVEKYPERAQYLALLKAQCGENLADAAPPVSLYHREPGLEKKDARPLVLPDVCLPELRIGMM